MKAVAVVPTVDKAELIKHFGQVEQTEEWSPVVYKHSETSGNEGESVTTERPELLKPVLFDIESLSAQAEFKEPVKRVNTVKKSVNKT